MSDELDEIRAAVRAIVAPYLPVDASPVDQLDVKAWAALEKLGFTALTVPEDLAGSGGTLEQAAAVVEASLLVPAPLAEATFLAGPLLQAGRIAIPAGPLTVAVCESVERRADGTLRGAAAAVPWIDGADHLLVLGGPECAWVAIVPTDAGGMLIERGTHRQGEPRGEMRLDDVLPSAIADLDPIEGWKRRVLRLGATARAVQIASATSAALSMTTRYAADREQFGRPLLAFQAIQQQLAVLAADATTARVASQAAVTALSQGHPHAALLVAAAKAETSALAGRAASVAHQVHGALGFTSEHRLGALTSRLWQWRNDFGNETFWHSAIADLVDRHGGDPWALVTA